MDEETFVAGPLRPRNDYRYPENDVFVSNNNSSSSKENLFSFLFIKLKIGYLCLYLLREHS